MPSATTRAELTEKLLGIKRENGWSWKHICAEIGGMSPVLVTDGAGILSFGLVVFSAENQAFSSTNKSCHPPSYYVVLSSSLANALANSAGPLPRR
jgi:acyl-CoA reductase-like NAD-dependent aldehyde dehydrogenase